MGGQGNLLADAHQSLQPRLGVFGWAYLWGNRRSRRKQVVTERYASQGQGPKSKEYGRLATPLTEKVLHHGSELNLSTSRALPREPIRSLLRGPVFVNRPSGGFRSLL